MTAPNDPAQAATPATSLMEAGSDPAARGYAARIGIASLNLILPGLGLMRLGKWRPGAVFMLAPFAMLAPVTFGMGHLPITGYRHAIMAFVLLVVVLATIYLVPITLTWRGSRLRQRVHGWSRWYGIIVLAVVALASGQIATTVVHNFYKPFYAPSESMAPTIAKGDKFIADMRWRGPFRRGQIILFQTAGGLRVSRIASLPGDRIAMRHGVPVLNGEQVTQVFERLTTYKGSDGAHTAKLLVERLPHARSGYSVLDSGPFKFDNFETTVVPPRRLFVLGDNRDRSADSRVPLELGGTGMVPLTAVVGRPLYIHWSGNHARIDTQLDE